MKEVYVIPGVDEIVPETDFMDPARAARGLADFTDYFGERPDANHQRNNNANRPHIVKAWT